MKRHVSFMAEHALVLGGTGAALALLGVAYVSVKLSTTCAKLGANIALKTAERVKNSPYVSDEARAKSAKIMNDIIQGMAAL